MTVSIERLDCGSLTCGLPMVEAGAADEPVELPVPSWLIRHPEGLVLVDTGMNLDLAGPGEYLDAVSPFFEVGLDHDRLVGSALQARDIDPAAVDVVVLSHLHFDHAGGLAQIPNARVVVQADEWVAGNDGDLVAANSYVPTDYLLGHDVVAVDGEHDVFGDGRITCVPTPGHTPGHQSVWVRLNGREVVLCCDCAYFERTLAGGPLPPLGHDHEQQADSIRRLQQLGAAGATLLPGHDLDVFAALPERIT